MKTDYARQQMVNQQVRGWHVYDERVLDVLRELPREHFVPAGYEMLAFADVEIPLGHGEAMMTPTIEGRLLQALGLEGHEKVLEVGTGSGFMSACLARLSDHVTSIDLHGDFVAAATQKLEQLGIDNVLVLEMDAMAELPEGPFDAIAVTGSVQRFEPRFVEALSNHGRLFIVEGSAPAMEAKLVQRTDDHDWQSISLFETNLKPLVHGALPPQFEF